jgi:cell division protein FtsB
MKKNRAVPVPNRLRRFRERRRHLLTHLAIAALGAFIFVRIVAKEKNRRQRYLLLRLADQKTKLAELEAAANGAAAPAVVDESQAPYEATAVGEAA